VRYLTLAEALTIADTIMGIDAAVRGRGSKTHPSGSRSS
jgi:hypothetical protein